MITLENIKLYKCSFCKKYLIKKHAMVKHEDFCTMNPKNQAACSGCIFLKETKTEIYGHDGYPYKYSKSFECEKLKKKLYPHKVIRKNLISRFPETFEDQELMPNNCSDFRYTEF